MYVHRVVVVNGFRIDNWSASGRCGIANCLLWWCGRVGYSDYHLREQRPCLSICYHIRPPPIANYFVLQVKGKENHLLYSNFQLSSCYIHGANIRTAKENWLTSSTNHSFQRSATHHPTQPLIQSHLPTPSPTTTRNPTLASLSPSHSPPRTVTS